MVVIGAGTGGTISGLAKRLKEKYPGIIVVGVDPIGSILSNPSRIDQLNFPYQVEGIGYDFIPKVLDRSLVDSWITTNDTEAFKMSRRLIKSEGLLCGGSSGSATWAAIKAIKACNFNFAADPTKRVLVILTDSVRNYMSKFLSTEWMFVHKFISSEDLQIEQGFKHVVTTETVKMISVPTIKSNDSVEDVLKKIKTVGQFPVVDSLSNEIIGNFDAAKLLQTILREGKQSAFSSNLQRFINKDFMLFNSESDQMSLLTASAANIPIYFSDSTDRAILSSEGLVQTMQPFYLI